MPASAPGSGDLEQGRAVAGDERVAEALGTGAPVDVQRLDPVAARAVGATGGSAILVRPDGVPAAVLLPADRHVPTVVGEGFEPSKA